jgi:hypothetical protein
LNSMNTHRNNPANVPSPSSTHLIVSLPMCLWGRQDSL